MSDQESKIHPSLLARFFRFINPVYHVRRFKEDLSATRKALRFRKEILHGNFDGMALPEVFRGKLFGVFFATGWTTTLGFLASWILQRATNSQWVGLYATPVLIYIITALAYQIGWYLDNKRLYALSYKEKDRRFIEFEKDLAPVHWTGFKFAVIFNVLNLTLGSLLTALVTFISEPFAKVFPQFVFIVIIEALFVAGPFVRIMGDFFDRYSYRLAKKYHGHLVPAED